MPQTDETCHFTTILRQFCPAKERPHTAARAAKMTNTLLSFAIAKLSISLAHGDGEYGETAKRIRLASSLEQSGVRF